jgi:hypothetical protein
MKRTLIAALAAVALGATVAAAAVRMGEEPSDPANCGLNARQVAAGWTCTEEVETSNISREIGGGSRCQDASITTSVYRAYNPSGNLAEDKTDVSEPEESDWGSSYPIGDGCNYPTS